MKAHLLLGFLVLGACSTPPAPEEGPIEFPDLANPRLEIDPSGDRAKSVGYLMTELDQGLRAWNNLKGPLRTEEEDRKMRGLESWIRNQVRLRLADVIQEVEGGPPNNRAVAAVALGFSALEEAQSPLLSALEDRDPLVVSNALLGLGILAMPDTPLQRVCLLLQRDADAGTRRNAAYALQRIVESGGRDECALVTARDALRDPEPSVRVMCAITLSLLEDGASLRSLGDLLYDEEEIVCVAAATSLASIGRNEEESMGEAARILVASLERVPKERRWRIHYELTRLRGSDLGEDTEAWRNWAQRMP